MKSVQLSSSHSPTPPEPRMTILYSRIFEILADFQWGLLSHWENCLLMLADFLEHRSGWRSKWFRRINLAVNISTISVVPRRWITLDDVERLLNNWMSHSRKFHSLHYTTLPLSSRKKYPLRYRFSVAWATTFTANNLLRRVFDKLFFCVASLRVISSPHLKPRARENAKQKEKKN